MSVSKKPISLDARIFNEAIPWIQKFHGKIVVIKYGGNAMISALLQETFANDIVWLHSCGIHPVIVHGGGPQITNLLEKLDIPTNFVQGVRVTTPEVMDVARMVMFGKVGRELVNYINQYGPYAVGMTGEDANTLVAMPRKVLDRAGKQIDVGLVGDIDHVDTSLILSLIESGKIPVISSIGSSGAGDTYNINADLTAGAVAQALGAEKLVFLTDVHGIYREWPKRESLISMINVRELRALSSTIESGMIPKVEACLHAVENGVPEAHIIDGRTPHSILTEIFTDDGIGTMILPE